MINDRVKNKYIRATSDEHGARIIQFLVENGGRNNSKWAGRKNYFYYIDSNGLIDYWFESDLPKGYTETHLPEELKRGDLVEVSDYESVWRERIFITKIEGGIHPFVTVAVDYSEQFNSGQVFAAEVWKHCRKVDTITLAEAEKQLGKKIVG